MKKKKTIKTINLKNPVFIYSNDYFVDIGAHVFPVEKYRLIKDRLIQEKYIKPSDIIPTKPATREQILHVHTNEFLEDLINLKWTQRTMFSELPLTHEIVAASILSAGGTILAGQWAMKNGIAIHIGGGFHHAFADHAEGFCYMNDIAICIRTLQNEGLIRKAFVIDCDLHQGNGTAHIFQEDDSVFTFSIHQENNYPVKRKSTIDIGLDDFVGDKEYLAQLHSVIPGEIDRFQPDLIIYVAGADPYMDDQLGSLKLTINGLKERDEWVIQSVMKRNIPLVIVLAGGYARNTEDTIRIHMNTCLVAMDFFYKKRR